ncbi:alpha/beta fold hydrolase [Nocardiopsis mangrovi]|uniref:Alpha/beta fold hydrolase n=1 Tax=Nocardiopsis mangrovi TaxID=1179818 RepID=A0ABV9DXB8_9ACTN
MTETRFRTLHDRRFGYLDFGGEGPVLLALHGHFGRARQFAPLAAALAGRYRVLALDQRGHGLSDNGGAFTPAHYVADAAAFLEALDAAPAAVLGHSMGGIVATLLAARRPDLVRALLVADIGMANHEPEVRPVLDVSAWPARAASRDALDAAIGDSVSPAPGYFLDSAVESGDGWRLLFDPADMMASQRAFDGAYWDEWAAGPQPALLMRGLDSFMLSAGTAARMAAARPGLRTVDFPGCGHWLDRDDPAAFADAVAAFLDGLPAPAARA